MSIHACVNAITRIVILISLITLSGAVARSAPQGAAPAGQPVTVEFRAVTSAGSPVIDLAAADVIVKIDGRERAVRSFKLFQLGAAPVGPVRAAIPAPFATNTINPNGPRDSLLVIDDESVAPGDEKRLGVALDQYLSGLGEGDRVGVITVQDRGLNVSFTSDRAKVRSSVLAMVGRARSSETADDAACRTRRVLDALISISGNLPSGTAPVTVLFFSTGITPPGTATMSTMGRSSSSTPTVVCEVQPRDYQQLEQAAVGSAMNLYVVATSLASSNAQRSGLENLAGLSGNAMVELVKGGDSDMVRVVRENSAWYRATFDPELAERNGSLHRVEVQVKRSGVAVYARPQVVIAKADPRQSNASLSAKDMLRDGNAHRDFEFRAAAYLSQEPDSDKVKVVVLLEPVDPSATVKSAVVGLYDSKGKLTVQGTGEAANLARRPSTLAILATPGVYRMRVAALDAAGRGGSVDADVNVSLSRVGAVTMGSLILGVADAGSFAGRLSFTNEPAALGYLEVSGVNASTKISATLELAETEHGIPLVTGTTKVLGNVADGRIVILGGVPIAQLPAGDVLVRISVSVDGKPATIITRTLRKFAK